jgi:arylsulfatase A-like enzyme
MPVFRALDKARREPVLRGEKGKTCTKRFWQWNRYTPDVRYNAAVRDGDWKLVRPEVNGIFDAPCCNPWLTVSMYAPEYFEQRGLITEPEPERNWQTPPPAELYNIAKDPNEEHDLAAAHPDIAHRLSRELETWFEKVEADRRAILKDAER